MTCMRWRICQHRTQEIINEVGSSDASDISCIHRISLGDLTRWTSMLTLVISRRNLDNIGATIRH